MKNRKFVSIIYQRSTKTGFRLKVVKNSLIC